MKTAAGVALASSLLATTAQAAYSLVENYDSSNFFSGFTFFDETDPTHGDVDYLDALAASQSGLAGYINHDMVYLGSDHVTTDPSDGRASTRVSSNKFYDHGLFIADIQHMPVGCGVWGAFWTLGNTTWPSGGEIDIIEGVNSQTTDSITLHTDPGCNMTSAGSASGTAFSTGATTVDCGADGGYNGCSLTTTDSLAYGTDFNTNGGGVYVMEMTPQAISVWFFARGTDMATSLATTATPDTSAFGTPLAMFTGCDIDKYFTAQQIIFDTTFCGDWAGSVWSTDATCSPLADTCYDYVQANPDAFVDAYWLINSVKVYQTTTTTKRRSPLQAKKGVVPEPFLA